MCDHPNREAAMVAIKDGVWCDPCIAPLVRALNESPDLPAVESQRFGTPMTTLASCCGHGEHPGRISLADGRELLIFPNIDAADGRTPDNLDESLIAETLRVAADSSWQQEGGYWIEGYTDDLAHAVVVALRGETNG